MNAGSRGSLLRIGMAALALFLGACDSGSTDDPTPTVAAPVFSPNGGTYTGSVEVTLTTATDGASIWYTIDGSTPNNITGTPYTGPFTLDQVGAVTVKAIAYKDGMTKSAVVTRTFTGAAPGQVEAPTFSPNPGEFDTAQNVTLSTATQNATIYYTMTSNGSEPTDPNTGSTEYTGPVALPQPATPGASTEYKIKAFAVASGMTDSSFATATYTITNPDVTTSPCIEVVGTSGTGDGETGISLQFNLSGATDFTTENYTASFDIFIPEATTAPTKLQTQYPNAAWAAMYFDKYGPFTKGAWQTITYTITKANRAWPSPTSDTPLNSDATKFRIMYTTAAADTAATYCLKNIRVTNGTNTPLDIQVTSSTNVAALGTYVARGTATRTLASY